MIRSSLKESVVVVCPDCGLEQMWKGRMKLSRHSTINCKDCKRKIKVKSNIKRI